jgi:hypothetical protein
MVNGPTAPGPMPQGAQPQPQIPVLAGLPVLTGPTPWAADFDQIGTNDQGQKVFVLRLRNGGGQIECWGTPENFKPLGEAILQRTTGIEIAREVPPNGLGGPRGS